MCPFPPQVDCFIDTPIYYVYAEYNLILNWNFQHEFLDFEIVGIALNEI